MAFNGPESDRLALRELYGSYSDRAFHMDRAGWLALFAPDGEWHIRGEIAKGPEALSKLWGKLVTGLETLCFFAEVGAIEVTGDTATGRAFCREIFKLGDGSIHKLVGRYEDDFARIDGAWRFARRKYTVLLRE